MYWQYEAFQDKVYIQMPPGFNSGISLKRPETTQIEYFWSPLDSNSKDLTTKKTWHITYHTAHIAYQFEVL